MAMSRRKQLHPKSLKDGDESLFVLPDELKCDEESHDILARVDVKQGHRFGPYPASLLTQSTDTETTNPSQPTVIGQTDPQNTDYQYQVLEKKHNWLARCSLSNPSSANLNVSFEDDQLFLLTLQSIPVGTRLFTHTTILPKINPMESDMKCSTSNTSVNISDHVKVKEEPVQSEEEQSQSEPSSTATLKVESSPKAKKTAPLIFTCEDCGIRFSNRSTLDAHRTHYCTKRDHLLSPLLTATTKINSSDCPTSLKVKSIKRKHLDISDSSLSTKRFSIPSNETYCSECDILFSKAENLLQHKLYYCRNLLNSAVARSIPDLSNFRPPIPFDRPIQIGQLIYVPVPVVPSSMDHIDPSSSSSPLITYDIDNNNNNNNSNQNQPLDLSKPKRTHHDEGETGRIKPSSPLDLTVEKSATIFHLLNVTTNKLTTNSIPAQIYECDYCSIRFSSVKTLHAHQENYCLEYRKHKKSSAHTPTNESKSSNNEINRSQSPSPSNNSKGASLSPIDSSSLHLVPHRSSPFMCRLCKYRGNTLRGMRMHFKFHLSNNEPCSDDDIIVTSTLNPPVSTILPSQILLKCTICSAMFDHEEALINHLKCVHIKENVLECLECHSRFCSKWNLIRHMKLTHTNIKCDDDEIEQDDEESNHDKDDVEEAKKDQECHEENESKEKEKIDDEQNLQSPNENSSDPVNLTRHVLIESMDVNSSKKLVTGLAIKKKFACPYCHIKFGSIDTLKQHMSNYCSSRPSNSTHPDDLAHLTKKKTITIPTNETFCSACQIPFRQKSSYEAHKMYYCRASQKAHVKMQA